jgi:hypothetical protein
LIQDDTADSIRISQPIQNHLLIQLTPHCTQNGDEYTITIWKLRKAHLSKYASTKSEVASMRS